MISVCWSNNALVKVTCSQAIKEFWFVSKLILISSFQWINFKMFTNPSYWLICESAYICICYSVKLLSCKSHIKHLESSWKSHVSSLVSFLIYSFLFFYLIRFIQCSNISRCAWVFQYNFCIQDYGIGNWMSLKLWLGVWLEDLQESVLKFNYLSRRTFKHKNLKSWARWDHNLKSLWAVKESEKQTGWKVSGWF